MRLINLSFLCLVVCFSGANAQEPALERISSSSLNPANFGAAGQVSDFTGANEPLTRAYTFLGGFASGTTLHRLEFTGTSYPLAGSDMKPLFEVAIFTGETNVTSDYPLKDLFALYYLEADYAPSTLPSYPVPITVDSYTVDLGTPLDLPGGQVYWLSITYLAPEMLAFDPYSDFVWEWKRANGLNPFTLSLDLFTGALTRISGQLDYRAYGTISN